jgi:protocatechuate 3,4-dioxygenase beta subunit
MRPYPLALMLLAAVPALAQAVREPIVGLPCQGCENVFEAMPARIESRARIAPKSAPGAPMVVVGRVLDAKQQPRPGIVVYAYQTDSRGIYPKAATVHGALRAWAKSDAEGRYAFDTIRPGSYPDGDTPEHIHLHVLEPGCATYYIEDIVFTDDPKLTPKHLRHAVNERGGKGISTPVRKDGVWYVTRDIHLGKGVRGYPGCDSGTAATSTPGR